VLLIIFIVWMTFTSLFALNADEAWIEWDRVIKAQLLVFGILFIMNTRERLHWLVSVVALSIGFWGIKGGIFTVISGGSSHVMGPSSSFIEDNNDLALAVVTVIPLLRYMYLQSERSWARLALGVSIALSALAVIGSYSRAGFLGLLAISLIFVIKSRHKFAFGVIMICGLAMMIQFMPQQWSDRMHTIAAARENQDDSVRGRLNAWAFAWNLAKARPIIGGGYRCFTEELFRRYAPDPDNYHAAHSIFLKILGEHGFPGLFIVFVLAFSTWASAAEVRRLSLQHDVVWAADLSAMLQVSMVGYAVGGAFSNLTYFGLPYQLMAMVVLLRRIAKREIADETEEPEPTGSTWCEQTALT